MASTDGIRFRAQEFLDRTVHPWVKVVAGQLGVRTLNPTELLLGAIYLSLQQLIEVVGQGGNYYRVTPFRVVGGGEAVRVVDVETGGRVREVSLWMDSAVGAPDPTIRLSTGASGTTGNGVRVQPGLPNELGKVPPNTTLYVSSTDDINGYVVERG